jgi:hypothetical protein
MFPHVWRESVIRRFCTELVDFLTAERSRPVAIASVAVLATFYVLTIYDVAFIFGTGPFWANPFGAFLRDAADTGFFKNGDAQNVQIGYLAFLHAGWHLPLFFVQSLGTPAGTNIIFMDAIPAVTLLGKIASSLAGAPINPYGLWVAACFILSAVFATLVVIEAGQRSLLSAIAASVLAITAPPLLHRFGHLPLLSHFVVIGALYLYMRDRRVRTFRTRSGCWAGWLCLAALINVYMFVMAALIYGASLLRRWRVERPSSLTAVKEPAIVGLALVAIMLIAGHVGSGTGTSPFAWGFGKYSMNLASPFWPQHSGLFRGFDAIVDATGGQYEGFNYLGFGAILIVVAGIVMSFRKLDAKLAEHRELFAALLGLFLFAVSHRVFLGKLKLLDLDYIGHLNLLVGMFRSSGRMFWPVFYAILLFGLIAVSRRLMPGSKVAFVLACCVLQLADTHPLRARLTMLTQKEAPRLLDQSEWRSRMARAAELQIDPPFQCKGVVDDATATAIVELQLAAVSAKRPTNSVYNARLMVNPDDCKAAALAARNGPWRDDTLYVFLVGGSNGAPAGWMPTRRSCQVFNLGVWCLGPPGTWLASSTAEATDTSLEAVPSVEK